MRPHRFGAISTGKYCKPELWDKRAKRMKGKTEDVRTLNTYLDTLEQKVFEAQLILPKSNAKITPSSLKKMLLGKKSNPIKLIEIFKKHNREIKSLIGKGYAKATYIRYETSLRHTQNFLKWKYETTDMEIQYINHEFITSYEFYLRSECNCQNNSAVKYIKNFKKIIRICLANGWLVEDPFSKYKSRVKITERVFLNADELEAISMKKFDNERLCQVRDIFLFSCYTGLSYIDIRMLKMENVVKGPDQEMWINAKRQNPYSNKHPFASIRIKVNKQI